MNEIMGGLGVEKQMTLDDLTKLMATNPDKAIELMEKGMKEEMLGIYDVELMRKYSDIAFSLKTFILFCVF